MPFFLFGAPLTSLLLTPPALAGADVQAHVLVGLEATRVAMDSGIASGGQVGSFDDPDDAFEHEVHLAVPFSQGFTQTVDFTVRAWRKPWVGALLRYDPSVMYEWVGEDAEDETEDGLVYDTWDAYSSLWSGACEASFRELDCGEAVFVRPEF